MATTNLSEFRGRGVVSKVVLADINGTDGKGMTGTEVLNVTNIRQLEQTLTEARIPPSSTWRLALVEISCDFAMPRHDETVFNSVHRRMNSGLRPAKPAEGVTRLLEVLPRANGKTIRASIELTGAKIPSALDTLEGWKTFRFETLRTLFQFQPPQSLVVDEEVHERLRHALRNLTRSFVGGVRGRLRTQKPCNPFD